MKKHIPNFLTLLNLLSGSIAIVFLFQSNITMVMMLSAFCLVMDVLDGLAARMLKVKSAIGKDLDSLADVVSFGLLPSLLLYQMMVQSESLGFNAIFGDGIHYVHYVVLITVLAAAYRLAKFNNDKRQTNFFYGLPTPAFAAFILAISYVYQQDPSSYFHLYLLNPFYLIGVAFVGSYLMVSEHPMFALKFDAFNRKTHSLQILFLVACVILLAVFLWKGIAYSVLLYVLLSLTFFKPNNDEIRSEHKSNAS
ncbi:MAG TPA: CDP-alcohol phosphatidyltransferase family protein [Bacteroidia bacterium]|nr:CDP-alcohol phosphatidyltransferase family protein [Bacteroidia bacterium]HNT80019.1 CDP-alcohol phosphatidyltransferase family protein [Bacteroidia bacterium]